jgi:uncharacterized membrane protein YciS (DUF1049 family)
MVLGLVLGWVVCGVVWVGVEETVDGSNPQLMLKISGEA